MGGCFVLVINTSEAKKKVCKARFVVQGHADTEKICSCMLHLTFLNKLSEYLFQ